MQTPQIVVTCDVDRSHDGEMTTRTFGLDGQDYEIDLCPDDSERLTGMLGPIISRGRKITRRQRRRSTADRLRSAAAREWALEQGLIENRNGRLPASVRRAYDDRNGQ